MNEYVRQYSIFIEVLSSPNAGPRQRALTGEMISLYSEMNHLLARTKGKTSISIWQDAANKLLMCMDRYKEAWEKFVEIQAGDPEGYVGSGVELSRAFQDSVDTTRVAVEAMRRELSSLGEVSWIY